MAYEKKDYDFTLFINEDATGNHPSFSGSIFISGQDIPIVGWKRTTKTGKQVIAGCKSIKKEPDQKKELDGWETHNASSDIPF